MIPLPRPIDESSVTDVQDLARRVFSHARQVDEHLRLLPTHEEIAIEIDPADLPLNVRVETSRVRGVVRMGTTADGVELADVGIGWRPSDDQGTPGVVITELSGTSAGTVYRCSLLIVGRRD